MYPFAQSKDSVLFLLSNPEDPGALGLVFILLYFFDRDVRTELQDELVILKT